MSILVISILWWIKPSTTLENIMRICKEDEKREINAKPRASAKS